MTRRQKYLWIGTFVGFMIGLVLGTHTPMLQQQKAQHVQVLRGSHADCN